MDVMHQRVKDMAQCIKVPVINVTGKHIIRVGRNLITNDMDNLPKASTAEQYHSWAGTLL